MASLALPVDAVARVRPVWLLTAATIALQVPYPLVHGAARDALTVTTVVVFAAASVLHAVAGRGVRYTAVLVVAAAGGGFAAEAVGVHTGVPFGRYVYTGGLGASLLGVPLVVPLAWLMMAHPAITVAGRLASSTAGRVAVGAWALASWDVFLDPQMVDAGHWRWLDVTAHLPGVPGVPLSNDGGWLLVALALAAVVVVGTRPAPRADDGPALTLWTWTWLSSTLANVAFFDHPAVAGWGAVAMGVVGVPLLARWRAAR